MAYTHKQPSADFCPYIPYNLRKKLCDNALICHNFGNFFARKNRYKYEHAKGKVIPVLKDGRIQCKTNMIQQILFCCNAELFFEGKLRMSLWSFSKGGFSEGNDACIISPNRRNLLFSWAWILKFYKILKDMYQKFVF